MSIFRRLKDWFDGWNPEPQIGPSPVDVARLERAREDAKWREYDAHPDRRPVNLAKRRIQRARKAG
jgi:hypothetical protein